MVRARVRDIQPEDGRLFSVYFLVGRPAWKAGGVRDAQGEGRGGRQMRRAAPSLGPRAVARCAVRAAAATRPQFAVTHRRDHTSLRLLHAGRTRRARFERSARYLATGSRSR
ncbi:hypothetical protein RR46_10093 [Papilio xuthus]|uniref:Uncharacterized protein n=1 Tax=Papilio xuthus TaxID=66420 RepID=A0A194Q5U8_PAPXU|nr:hypothetical protein RR46_10093 [Papilio xuthus]